MAIFDLDNTLIAGDSDHAWGEFLVEQGAVDPLEYRTANDRFHQDYINETLDLDAYLRFSLAPLASHSRGQLAAWHQHFMASVIEPIILPRAEELLARHRANGDYLLIITATNRFITGPIAERLGVDDLIAIEVEEIEGRYTGNPTGVPSFREGKITRLEQWLEAHDMSLEDAFFYSDSRNDLPLLKQVDHPVAVDPDEHLRAYAEKAGWRIMSLRDPI
nr:HAD family hydrolase [Larsenimonas rhizosphaerae]